MQTIIDLFEGSVKSFGPNVYLREKRDSKWIETTYTQTKEQVYRLAAGFMALGIQKGDRVGLLAEGRNYWIISEIALLYAGVCSVPLSVKLDGPDLAFRLQHSGSRYLIVSGLYAAKVKGIKHAAPSTQGFIFMDETVTKEDGDYYLSDIFALGDEYLLHNPGTLESRINEVGPDDLANISYTSGTTADPKGIMLTHLNYAANVKQALTLMDIPQSYRTLAILPWDHSFAHTASLYCFMAKGASVASVDPGRGGMETLKNIPINIREVKPNLLMSVPALTKNFKKNIVAGVMQKGPVAAALFKTALSTAFAYNGDGYNAGKGWRAALAPAYAMFDRILFKKIREGLGGELDFFIGGGALLDKGLQQFFLAIGIPVCQGYGLSEAAPIISSNSLKNLKIGTSGKLVKYLELKICDENGKELPKGVPGEIVIRGENVMKGYWNNPKATAEALKDGWLFTGDMGYMDEDDYLMVLGRFKSLLISSDGEKYSPEGIEETVVNDSKLIDQIMLHNNQNPYTVALVVPNIPHINRELEKEKIAPGTPEAVDAALNFIQRDIRAYFKGGKHAGLFPERWLPSAVLIAPEPFSEQNGLMNASLKLVRHKVAERYAREIFNLFQPEAREILNGINRENLGKYWLKS